MKRTAIPYKQAIQWIVNNDDTTFLEEDGSPISVTASFVADIYGRSDYEVIADLRSAMETMP